MVEFPSIEDYKKFVKFAMNRLETKESYFGSCVTFSICDKKSNYFRKGSVYFGNNFESDRKKMIDEMLEDYAKFYLKTINIEKGSLSIIQDDYGKLSFVDYEKVGELSIIKLESQIKE